MTAASLEVQGLCVAFDHPLGLVRAVDDVSFVLRPNERFGLVGESGSGKSTMALAIMRMIRPPGHIVGGNIKLGGANLSTMSDDTMRRTRLAGVALVPQGSMNALNPVMRVGAQVVDAMRDHNVPTRDIDLLMARVGLPPGTAEKYPHELSGGMKQRVCIAIAICLRPSVIIADEPTSALDVVVQRQVMRTLADVQQDLNAAILLIGHDMGLMAQFVDRLGVMYAGRLVEIGVLKRDDGPGAKPPFPLWRLHRPFRRRVPMTRFDDDRARRPVFLDSHQTAWAGDARRGGADP